MSWDISFCSAESPPPPVAEMPSDWRGSDFGKPDDVREKISKSLPSVDWTDPSWGLYEGESFSYEFNLGLESPCTDFMVHVRGGGAAVGPLLDLARRWGWYMLDTSQGEWVHHIADSEAGWVEFQKYRDRVAK